MKLCSTCEETKPFAAFHASNQRAGARVGDGTYVQSRCKACQVLDRRRSNARNRTFMHEQKLREGCLDCGYRAHACALDFHHIAEKSFGLGTRYALQAPISKLKTEIAKCVVLCAVCHRIRHHLKDQNAAD